MKGKIKQMKKLTLFLSFVTILIVFVGCMNHPNKASTPNSSANNSILDPEEETTHLDENMSTDDSEKTYDDDEKNPSSGDSDHSDNGTLSDDNDLNVKNQEDKLSKYSSEQIEYARVWLQHGANQDLETLIVQHIPAGTPLNPDDDTGVNYAEDVIQLRGSRLIDGVVTYSGNGDGTINVYNVPSRWYGGFPPSDDINIEKVREDMKIIVHNPKLVYVDAGSDGEIIDLIKVLNICN